MLLLAACSREAARIGDQAITERDVDLRAQVSEIYYPGSGKRYVGLSQLIKGYLEREVLSSLGRRIDRNVLEAEAKRIDRSTKAPETLAKIKNVYGADRDAYLETFVACVYAERTIYGEVFLKSPAIHTKPLETIQAVLASATQKPASFKSVALQQGLDYARLRISGTTGIIRLHEQQSGSERNAGQAEAARIIAILAGRSAGSIVPQVIEWQESYQVLRLVKWIGKDAVVESAAIAKRNYDEWFWELASRVPVRISDKRLQDELLREVSWAKNLRLVQNP